MILQVPAGPLVAARTYLLEELEFVNNPLWVGVSVPRDSTSYALLSRVGLFERSRFSVDYSIRVRVFDADAVRCESNADLLWALMRSAGHRKILVPNEPTEAEPDPAPSLLWVSSAVPGENGPSNLDDPDVPLFGLQFSVRWTIALKAP